MHSIRSQVLNQKAILIDIIYKQDKAQQILKYS